MSLTDLDTPPDLSRDSGARATSGRTIVAVPLSSLIPGESPRLNGQDQAHIARLAEVETPLPPILVARRGMRVIDGMHRLMAAVLRGRETIDVEFFDGPESDIFLCAVAANVTHGFPLSQTDRRLAAEKIIATHPHMSDRAIAEVAGLGAKTVAGIRRRATGATPQLATRIGKDGKIRPLDGSPGRQRAAELIMAHPGASLREVARGAGISLATASDVRRRMLRGESPVLNAPQETDDDVPPRVDERTVRRRQPELPPNPVMLLEKLLRDPSLRLNEGGRQLLRLLRHNTLGARERSDLISSVPSHCGTLVAQLAQQYAQMWTELATEIQDRTDN